MEKCECFRLATNYHGDYCAGTKECDPCSCGGDPSKCDFYESVRRKVIGKMKTLEMMNEAYKTHKIYKAGDMLFDHLNGFYGRDGHSWGGYAFENINDLFDVEWIEKPENEMTKAEAEAKFNIKIVG